jgi:hypothetical protein
VQAVLDLAQRHGVHGDALEARDERDGGVYDDRHVAAQVAFEFEIEKEILLFFVQKPGYHFTFIVGFNKGWVTIHQVHSSAMGQVNNCWIRQLYTPLTMAA